MGSFEPPHLRPLVGRLIHYSMAAGLKNEQNPQYIHCARSYIYITEQKQQSVNYLVWPLNTVYAYMTLH